MKRKAKTKLSFFEAVWMWILIYMVKWNWKVRGDFEGGVTTNLTIVQTCNLFVVYYIALKTFHFEGEFTRGKYGYDALMFLGLIILLEILNTRLIERRVDSLTEVHNALTQRERDRDRLLTWIYVVGSIVLLIAMVLVQEFVYNR